MRALVTGAGGAIGGHLVRRLIHEGFDVRAVDVKRPSDWWQTHVAAENWRLDLADEDAAVDAVRGVDWVFHLAETMGGIAFISSHHADCILSAKIGLNVLEAARDAGVERMFFSSSACAYNTLLQDDADVRPLRESDAWPAHPEDGYGLTKLFMERACEYFTADYGIETRVARYHNIYGPHGAWDGGREKAPAAICRKVAHAVRTGSGKIEIYGDGRQTRSFCYVDDCVEGTMRIMTSDHREPLNLGSDRLVTIDELVTIVEGIAGVQLERCYDLDAPQGVRGRNSDNTLIRHVLDWEPSIPLEDGLVRTYAWIDQQLPV